MTATYNGREYAKLVRRTYFIRDSAACFDMIYDNGEERYLLPDGRFFTKSEFMAEFIKRLNLTEKDTVIIDRFSQWKYVQPLFQFGNKARFIAVFHTGHYFEENEGPVHLLYLNEEYYYPFRNAKFIDTIVVSTEEQKKRTSGKADRIWAAGSRDCRNTGGRNSASAISGNGTEALFLDRGIAPGSFQKNSRDHPKRCFGS